MISSEVVVFVFRYFDPTTILLIMKILYSRGDLSNVRLNRKHWWSHWCIGSFLFTGYVPSVIDLADMSFISPWKLFILLITLSYWLDQSIPAICYLISTNKMTAATHSNICIFVICILKQNAQHKSEVRQHKSRIPPRRANQWYSSKKQIKCFGDAFIPSIFSY